MTKGDPLFRKRITYGDGKVEQFQSSDQECDAGLKGSVRIIKISGLKE